jgi:hypothetical protein
MVGRAREEVEAQVAHKTDRRGSNPDDGDIQRGANQGLHPTEALSLE